MRNRILYTSGPDLGYWPLSEQRIRDYATKVEAELVVMPKRAQGNPQWALFDAMAATPKGSIGAWVDADIIISADAPDIFDYGGRLMVCEPSTPRRVHPKWRRGHGHQGVGVPNMRPYPVTGVVSWGHGVGKKLSEWLATYEPSERCRPKWGDQEVLALAIWELDIGMHYFPSNFHKMMGPGAEGIDKTFFAHAAGSTRKPAKLKAFEVKMKQKAR